MIIETTNYFAKPGKQADVLAQRRAATRIRIALGLKPGTIMIRRSENGPDVRWHCEFEDGAAFERDLQARGASPEFAAARNAMHELLERFERHVHETAPDDETI